MSKLVERYGLVMAQVLFVVLAILFAAFFTYLLSSSRFRLL
jgi:hypothetical protein